LPRRVRTENPNRRAALCFALALVAAACTNGDSKEPAASSKKPALSTAAPTIASPPTTVDCFPSPLLTADDLPTDPVDAALRVSQTVYSCVDSVVVTTSDDQSLAAASVMAIEQGAVLLVTAPDRQPTIDEELDRLQASNVVYVTNHPEQVPADVEIVRADSVRSPTEIIRSVGAQAARTATKPPTWLVTNAHLLAGLAATPAIVAGGGSVLLADDPPAAERLEQFAVVGDFDPSQRWALVAPHTAAPLPGGGTLVFPGHRIIAFYGSPVTFRLGLLGEQGAQATIDRLAPVVADYQVEGGDPAVAGFELIATVADSKPGDDGDYSNELTVEELRPWIDVAAANGAFVIIDLQPGRTDFLTQAMRYEEFLRLPFVGLALDPEWRLEPDEVHLRQIGSVDAIEVNAVIDWMSELVRDHHLPQKILVLHQFNLDMIENREQIRTPPELAVVVHVDGQGPLGSKYGTWNQILEAPRGPDQVLWWGWKNFIDEDFPTATAGQVNAVDPLPVVVTFQ
jgi:hypothetical protein